VTYMQLKIAFVILTWNSETYIKNCLDSIKTIENLNTSICVVDNGSSDHTKQIIVSHFPNVELITLKSNIGTTKSRNLALKKIPTDANFICVLDSDTIVTSTAINALVSSLIQNERYGIAVPSMANANQEPQISCKKFPNLPIKFLKPMPLKKLEQIGKHMENYDFSSNKPIFEVDYGISACWMIKKSCFDAVGLLDENIFYAPEDVDYCLRTWKAGFKVIYVPSAHIVHDTQRISRKKYISHVNYEHIKGLLYFFHKHGYWFRRPRFK
jgi:hypothetical protein